jgi:hypothetical protein
MFTAGYTRYVVVSLSALAGTVAAFPLGWFDGS